MAWLNGWQYRKKITISGSSGAGTNYQVLLKVGESSGAIGANFHINGHSANFPTDIRFTADDGTTLLSFWVEQVTGTSPNRTAYVWVKVAADLGTNKNIYIYYGNSSASNVSNGDNTFLLFDDFEGTSLDTSKWSILDQDLDCSYSVSNSRLRVQQGPGPYGTWQHMVVGSLSTFGSGRVFGGRIIALYESASIGIDKHFFIGFSSNDNLNSASYGRNMVDHFWYAFYDPNRMYLRTRSAEADTLIQTTLQTVPYIVEVGRLSSEVKIFYNHTYETNLTTNIPTGTYPFLIYATGGATSGTIYADIDWIFIRKFVSPEPAFSFADAEETAPVPSSSRRLFLMSM